ncbi:hypothetical protein C2845_PM17G04170 [Panicum miliaceum]|uniref:Uncharacterized protein n=1 Tax=Panicum miliaceum TaxID=4540 RepID=A0A3L6Q3E3_PANMI|nr:hypothetical protein C2845_PM17G04170 [Panicum miliaceum]
MAAAADDAGGSRRNGESGRPKLHTRRPEEWTLNRNAMLQAYILMAVTGLGCLALMWPTVVLLGGFVSSLGEEDFWCQAVIGMIQAARIFNDFGELLFLGFLRDLLPMLKGSISIDVDDLNPFTAFLKIIAIGLCLIVSMLFILFVEIVFLFAPLICVGLSLWRIAQRNYGNMDGPDKIAANMTPALDIFYSLVLCQCALFFVCIAVAQRKPSIKGRNLINYAVGLLGSESPEEYLSGARLLGAFVEMGEEDVRSLLLPSRPKIQKLIDTLRWRSSPNEKREIRELAATILADLAGDIDLAQYPRAIRCISCLLQEETTQTYWNRNQRVPHPQLHQKRVWPLTTEERRLQEVEEEIQLLELKRKERYMQKWMQVQERSRQNRMEMEELRRKWMTTEERRQQRRMITEGRYQQGRIEKQDNDDVHQQEELDLFSSGDDREQGTCNRLVLQGLTILERLASDHNNCVDICSAPGLLPKIMAPICSNTLIQDIGNNGAWADVVNGSFKVLHCLICAPGETSRSLRVEISSDDKPAVSNLQMILDQGNRSSQELKIQAMKILTELALDSSIELPEKTAETFIKKQHEVFLCAEGEQVPATVSKPRLGEH